MTGTSNPRECRTVRGNFVLLQADTLSLLLPQSDVGAAQYLAEIPMATEAPGVFQYGDEGERLLVALSAGMTPLPQYPQTRFLVTPVTSRQGELHFGWSKVDVLIDTPLQVQPVPATLVAPYSPLREFVEISGRVAFCCDAEHLINHSLGQGA